MAYELKELGWYDEDIKSISSSISGQIMTITITLQNGNTLDTTVTLPEATGAKVTNISNAIVDNKLTTTVTLSDGNSVTSEAVDLPTVNISGKQDKEINLTGFTAKTVEGALTEAKAAGEAASTNLTAHIDNKENPHGVTAAQVGLGNVNNTSDADKPVSTAQQTALDDKLDKVKTTTPNPQVYAKNADGTQGMVNVGGTADDNIATVAQVKAAGIQVVTPTYNGDDITVTEAQRTILFGDEEVLLKFGDDETTNYARRTYKSSTQVQFEEVVGAGVYAATVSVYCLLSTSLEITHQSVTPENVFHKTSALSDSSTNDQYPSAKAVVDYVKANAQTANFITLRTTSGTLSDADFTKLDSDDNSYILLIYSGQKYKLHKTATSTTDLIYSVVDNEQEYKITILLSDHTWALQVITLENTANRVTEIKASSADEEYPSAAATYAYGQTVLTGAKAYADSILGAEQTWLAKIDSGEGV